MKRAPAAAIVLGLAGIATPAAAQHHHGGGEGGGRRAWWASVSTVMTVGAGHVRDASTGFVDETRGYQGVAVALAGGWRRLGARLALGGYHVGDRGTGLDDLHASATADVAPAGPVRAGVMAAVAMPTGDADAGRGMGHMMMHGGAWARGRAGRVTVDGAVTYARALGDGAEHAAHLHGGDGWPLVDPMNAVEVDVEGGAALAAVPGVLALRAGALIATPIGVGVRRVIATAGVHLDRGRFGAGALIAMPVIGDPFVARGQLELGYRF